MSHQHAHTHTHTHTHTHANINSTQPDTLSHRLDTYTLPKPNQTPTTHSNNNIDTVCNMLFELHRAKRLTKKL